jgi:hypothetical protein
MLTGGFGHIGSARSFGGAPSGISNLKTWTAQKGRAPTTVSQALGNGFSEGVSNTADFVRLMASRSRNSTYSL